ncbi:MAG: C40 family peptidase, partial [Spirochaetaceae bacterium]|nr:C40 family peptidase [Spirochaetaceae bacterium]
MRKIAILMLVVSVGAAAQAGDAALRKRIVDMALGFQGVPYVYGSESPAAFDCSGLVHYVYKKAANVDIPRNSRDQHAIGLPIGVEAAQLGDVFVFNTSGSGPSHVAISLGDGTMIHAISEGPKTGVVVSKLTDRYFGPRLIAARSFLT